MIFHGAIFDMKSTTWFGVSSWIHQNTVAYNNLGQIISNQTSTSTVVMLVLTLLLFFHFYKKNTRNIACLRVIQ